MTTPPAILARCTKETFEVEWAGFGRNPGYFVRFIGGDGGSHQVSRSLIAESGYPKAGDKVEVMMLDRTIMELSVIR